MCLRSKQFGMEDTLFFFETFEEGDWVPFRKPWGMCMGKPVWATGISSKRRSAARTKGLHHGRGEPVFVIRNAMEKVCIVHSLTHFCSSGPVIHLQGPRFTDPSEPSAHSSP